MARSEGEGVRARFRERAREVFYRRTSQVPASACMSVDGFDLIQTRRQVRDQRGHDAPALPTSNRPTHAKWRKKTPDDSVIPHSPHRAAIDTVARRDRRRILLRPRVPGAAPPNRADRRGPCRRRSAALAVVPRRRSEWTLVGEGGRRHLPRGGWPRKGRQFGNDPPRAPAGVGPPLDAHLARLPPPGVPAPRPSGPVRVPP